MHEMSPAQLRLHLLILGKAPMATQHLLTAQSPTWPATAA
jgi:hypothetical protein